MEKNNKHYFSLIIQKLSDKKTTSYFDVKYISDKLKITLVAQHRIT